MCPKCGSKWYGEYRNLKCTIGCARCGYISKDINEYMQNMSKEIRYRWCESKQCWCMGCVNNVLIGNGFTKEDWQKWVKENETKSD